MGATKALGLGLDDRWSDIIAGWSCDKGVFVSKKDIISCINQGTEFHSRLFTLTLTAIHQGLYLEGHGVFAVRSRSRQVGFCLDYVTSRNKKNTPHITRSLLSGSQD